MIDFNKMLNDFLDDIIDGKLGGVRKEIAALRALPLVQLSEMLNEGNFRRVVESIVESIVEAKLTPIHERLKALEAAGLSGSLISTGEDITLTAEIQVLVDNRIEHFLEKHNKDYDHDDFVTESDLKTKVDDWLNNNFQSKVEATIDGLRVTLNT